MKPDRWNGKGAGVSDDSDLYVKLPSDWIIHWADGFHPKFAVGKTAWIWYNQSVIVRFFSAQQGVWRCQEARIINLFLACEGMCKRWPKYFLFAMGVSGQHMNRGQKPLILLDFLKWPLGIYYLFKFMAFFNSAVTTLQTIVVGLGGALCVWGGINLLEGYGQDNPASNARVP